MAHRRNCTFLLTPCFPVDGMLVCGKNIQKSTYFPAGIVDSAKSRPPPSRLAAVEVGGFTHTSTNAIQKVYILPNASFSILAATVGRVDCAIAYKRPYRSLHPPRRLDSQPPLGCYTERMHTRPETSRHPSIHSFSTPGIPVVSPTLYGRN